MATFAWEGRTRNGEIRKGTMDADAEPDVTARLRAQNIAITRINKRGRTIDWRNLQIGNPVKERDMVVFTRQLATMIDAGLPIVQSLDILAGQAESKGFGKILYEVKGQVEQGTTLSEALKKRPKAFSDLFTNLIAAGEAGGILDRILARLAAYIEKSASLKRKIRGAMVYPAAIFIIAIAVVTVMLWKVIPVFENMFKEFGNAALPAPTRLVIRISHGFTENLPMVALTLLLLSVGFTYSLRTPGGRRVFDAFILKTPVFGSLLRKVAVARFCRTLGTLLTAGVPILDALEIVAKTAGNVIVASAIMHARTKISEGKNIAEPLGQSKVFPSMVVQMIAVGEQTGAMDTMLQKIADFYEDEVDVAVESLTRLMEPMMMVFLGGIIGGLLLAMYMPIFELAGNIKGG